MGSDHPKQGTGSAPEGDMPASEVAEVRDVTGRLLHLKSQDLLRYQELFAALRADYRDWQKILQQLNITGPGGQPHEGDIPLPGFPQILAQELAPKITLALRELLGPIALVLIPERDTPQNTWIALLQAINVKLVAQGHEPIRINEDREAFGPTDLTTPVTSPIIGWRAYVGEVAQEMTSIHAGDDLDASRYRRRRVRREWLVAHPRLKGTDRLLWTGALIRALNSEKPGIDGQTWTMLDADLANSDDFMPCAGCPMIDQQLKPDFSFDFVDAPFPDGDLRLWIGGDVLFR